MSPIYLIWSIRLAGWISRSGGSSSDHRDAREFDLDEAIIYCRKQRDGQGNFISFPVSLDNVRAISE